MVPAVPHGKETWPRPQVSRGADGLRTRAESHLRGNQTIKRVSKGRGLRPPGSQRGRDSVGLTPPAWAAHPLRPPCPLPGAPGCLASSRLTAEAGERAGLGLTLRPAEALHPSPPVASVSWSFWREHWAPSPGNSLTGPSPGSGGAVGVCSPHFGFGFGAGGGSHGNQLGRDGALVRGDPHGSLAPSPPPAQELPRRGNGPPQPGPACRGLVPGP